MTHHEIPPGEQKNGDHETTMPPPPTTPVPSGTSPTSGMPGTPGATTGQGGNWRRMLIFLAVLTVGMALAWIACEVFPATPPKRQATDETRNRGLLELGLLRGDMARLRPWRYIVLHHSATAGGSVESINGMHIDRGWDGIGYHIVIGNGSGMDDGRMQPTYRWWQQETGAHALPDGTASAALDAEGGNAYNRYGIGIVLIGNFNDGGPTAAQFEKLASVVAALAERFNVPMSNIVGHRDIKLTDCPGRQFPMEDVLRRVADLRLRKTAGQ